MYDNSFIILVPVIYLLRREDGQNPRLNILIGCVHYVIMLRVKFIKKQYYVRPSMHKFQKLLTTTCKRELFRLMTFIKFVFKDYNNRLTCS